MLSGERSSGEMQDGLRGLLGLPLRWHGLYNPYPIRKYSIGTSIACGCSSVTIDPQPWTCQINPLSNMLHAYLSMLFHIINDIMQCMHSQFVIIINQWLGSQNHKVNQENMLGKLTNPMTNHLNIFMSVHVCI